MDSDMKIAVIGIGYVGLSSSILLAQNHSVWAFDISAEKIQKLKKGECPVSDAFMEKYLQYKKEKNLMLYPTEDFCQAVKGTDYIIIAAPTDFNDKTGSFDTRAIEEITKALYLEKCQGTVIVKSTVPVGYTQQLQERYPDMMFMFVPEFLREGKALEDNLYPSRIIVGMGRDSESYREQAKEAAGLFLEGAVKKEVPILIMKASEAEAVKLFANTYLAVRVAFFNELDTFAQEKKLDAASVINGVCMDPRIGVYYNNPSFGYGGYCLPKDTRQLEKNFEGIPQKLITAAVEANQIRKLYVLDCIDKRARLIQKEKRKIPVIGIYRLVMKAGSDNFRQAAVLDIIKGLFERGYTPVLYEPECTEEECCLCKVERNLEEFKKTCDLIIANRMEADLKTAEKKVYTRDLFAVN